MAPLMEKFTSCTQRPPWTRFKAPFDSEKVVIINKGLAQAHHTRSLKRNEISSLICPKYEALMKEVDKGIHRTTLWRLFQFMDMRKWLQLYRPELKPEHSTPQVSFRK
ncbi:hypothetical protein BGW36DRAFT_368361 [Talaromyces proteolyticus]|uniref:Uncharacterized protein n=1 Tax=Talaromyces proteolyticus TaxID=1131652 RepID=A0AAD4Q6P1_9EURO|nr:uncharacterized protein BGW36DRAFT_368361 [Talaromyces proteolyticus]KAH8705911.1 hypothetical protein BGW36DRAFT_368361 [Talaromyces proteolyticus]